MVKSKIVLIIFFLLLFQSVSIFSLNENMITETQSLEVKHPNKPSIAPCFVPHPLGIKDFRVNNLTGTVLSITIDGDFSDWINIPFEKAINMNYSLAFNYTHFFVWAKWIDSSFDNLPSRIVKTAYDYSWEIGEEFNDAIEFSFANETFTDYWTWTASTNMTNGVYAYERSYNKNSGQHLIDDGNKPHLYNWDYSFPIYDNNKNPLTEFNPPTGTSYWMWLGQTPTDSQTNVHLKAIWKDGYYQIEMVRLLNTGQPDDLVINFTDNIDYVFSCAAFDKDVSIDEVSIYSNYEQSIFYCNLGIKNEQAWLTFNEIEKPITSSITISGNAYDDYRGWKLEVHLTGWDNIYGPGRWIAASLNTLTGNWSYYFTYTSNLTAIELPIGNWEIWVRFTTKYNDPIMLKQSVTVVDSKPPKIYGVTTIEENDLIFLGDNTVQFPITVGLDDDHDFTDNLTVILYVKVDNSELKIINMVHYSSGGRTFNANVSLQYEFNAYYYFTYFIIALDTSLNGVTSENYDFGLFMPSTELIFLLALQIGTFGIISIGIFMIISIFCLTSFLIKEIRKKCSRIRK